MKRLGCRNLVLFLAVVSAMAGLGDRALNAQTAIKTSPTVNVVRLTNVTSQIWTADFNGDGFVDLAATAPSNGEATAGKVRVAFGSATGTRFVATFDTAFTGHVVG